MDELKQVERNIREWEKRKKRKMDTIDKNRSDFLDILGNKIFYITW